MFIINSESSSSPGGAEKPETDSPQVHAGWTRVSSGKGLPRTECLGSIWRGHSQDRGQEQSHFLRKVQIMDNTEKIRLLEAVQVQLRGARPILLFQGEERETVTWAAFKQNLLRTQASTINQSGAAGRALATDSPPASPAVTKTKRSLGSGITNKTNR